MIGEAILEYGTIGAFHCKDIFDLKGTCKPEDVHTFECQVDTTESSISFVGDRFPNLRKLKLNNSIIPNMRDIGCRFTNLRFLSLARCGITSLNGISTISKVLEELYLAFNKIDDCSELVGMDSLLVIDLEENNISDLSNIEFLSTCSNLQSLTLAGNPCVDDPETYRSKVRGLLPKLRYLDEKRLQPKEERPNPRRARIRNEITYKKIHPKEPETEKIQPKEPETEKIQPKEPETQKIQPKEPETEKIQPKEPETQKIQPKEPETEKIQPKEPETEKAQPNNKEPEKTQSNESTTEKIQTKQSEEVQQKEPETAKNQPKVKNKPQSNQTEKVQQKPNEKIQLKEPDEAKKQSKPKNKTQSKESQKVQSKETEKVQSKTKEKSQPNQTEKVQQKTKEKSQTKTKEKVQSENKAKKEENQSKSTKKVQIHEPPNYSSIQIKEPPEPPKVKEPQYENDDEVIITEMLDDLIEARPPTARGNYESKFFKDSFELQQRNKTPVILKLKPHVITPKVPRTKKPRAISSVKKLD